MAEMKKMPFSFYNWALVLNFYLSEKIALCALEKSLPLFDYVFNFYRYCHSKFPSTSGYVTMCLIF